MSLLKLLRGATSGGRSCPPRLHGRGPLSERLLDCQLFLLSPLSQPCFAEELTPIPGEFSHHLLALLHLGPASPHTCVPLGQLDFTACLPLVLIPSCLLGNLAPAALFSCMSVFFLESLFTPPGYKHALLSLSSGLLCPRASHALFGSQNSRRGLLPKSCILCRAFSSECLPLPLR